ncbi:nicotinate-nucleotide--dimethylbenzimidazole phosphoribosyltransferase [Streptomyces sp. NPDC088733]|uniref:nicotinate-nucleotide--dimethylbenzimidazole phosphoribosyltransferase n=1 Tax=Streptomyces sp. NPDC088733 TaxID=3365880 RepID=UPI0038233EFA
MTDTGQVPGEGLPENAGGEAVLQPHADLPGSGAQQPVVPTWETDPLNAPVPPAAYAYLDQPVGPAVADEDEEMLLMPGLQGSWADPQPVPPQPAAPAAVPVAPVAPAPMAAPVGEPAPVAPAMAHETHVQVHEQLTGALAAPVAPPGGPHEHDAHESGGRDSGSLDYSAVRASATPPAGVPVPGAAVDGQPQAAPAEPLVPAPAPAPALETLTPEPVVTDAAVAAAPQAFQEQVPATPAPVRRPLHMGPPIPDPSNGGGVVRSLADRGPATSVPQSVPVTPPPVAAVPPVPSTSSIPSVPSVPSMSTVPTEPSVPSVPETPAAATPVVPVPPSVETPLRHAGPPTTGPEYLDIPRDEPSAAGAAWAAPEQEPEVAAEPEPEPVPELAELPIAPQAEEVAAPAPEPEPVAEALPEPAVVEAEPLPLDSPDEPLPFGMEPEPEPEPEPVAREAVVPEIAAPEIAAPEVVVPEFVEVAEVVEPVAVSEDAGASVPEAAESAGPDVETVEGEDVPELLLPAAEGYEPAVRDAVHRVIRERRDIRNGFRNDPIPHEVLIRVLEAAHTAPSVGHSQPWDFVVIRSAETRQRMHELAMQQRDAFAKSLPKGRAKQFRELKIEAILDTPVNIVVTADPTRGGRHTLGRYTQPQMAPYSSALAVENLWLAARAEGLGVGWVSFFDEREMVRELGLPEHLEVVAYLCVGYVDEFPEDPELVQSGWSKRRPLAWVVHEEEYGNRALPGEEPHDLLEETLRGIRPLDAKALGEAWERQKRMTKPAGALGMLEIISAQLSGLSRQCPPPIPEPAAVAIFAGDHGVHAQGVTAWPQEVTGQMVANFLGGGAVCNAFANQVGAEVCVVDVGVASELPSTPGLLPRKVRPGTGDFTAGPAMSREEVLRAIEVGIETARDLVAAGNKALLTGEMGVANTTVSAALISVYTGVDPAEVTGRGTGINDEMHARKVDVVRRALELHRPDPSDPIEVLAAIGGLEHAAMVGLLLGAASLRTPVILDGVSAGAAALVARAIAPEVLAACIAGHRSAEPGHRAALTKLGLRPLVDLDLRLGEGTGALLALPLVQSAARAMHEVATFDSAGVTEKG